MKLLPRVRARALTGAFLVSGALLAGAPDARATHVPLRWEACGETGAVECTTVTVPRDYGRRHGEKWKLAVARSPATDQANRIGALFFNFGGPGGPAVEYLEAYGTELLPALNTRFDIIAMDPRGVGRSSPSIDCAVNQEELGIYSQPFATPFNTEVGDLIAKIRSYIDLCIERNGTEVFKYVSTADVARDMNKVREHLGEDDISYLGYSYGTFLGATFGAMFPHRYRALVLDGAVDADEYINDPMQHLAKQTAAFERGLGRFFQACAADQAACSGFGAADPWSAYDELVDQANAAPIPATGYAPDPRPIDGDDVNAAALAALYAKQLWGMLGAALSQAAAGDGSGIRRLVDEFFYARDPETGAFDPLTDRYFTLSATEQRYPRDIRTYIEAAEESWGSNEHFSLNNGLVELNWALFPIKARHPFRGPFRIPADAATPLVVGTRYDVATPYRSAVRLVQQMGNARLLTMIGDGHTAYGGNSACIDAAVEAYLFELQLPAEGTKCRQEVPFEAPAPPEQAGTQRAGLDDRRPIVRPHVKPLLVP